MSKKENISEEVMSDAAIEAMIGAAKSVGADEATAIPEDHQCGYVGLVGRPNVGKSTLLNRILGEKVSIISRKPQTTRNRVVGIWNTDSVQAIMVDTPGHHEARAALNKALVREAEAALSDVDVVSFIVDVVPAAAQARKGRPIFSKGEEVLLERIKSSGKPAVLVLNKIDTIEVKWLLPVIEAWKELHDFAAIIPISALNGESVDKLLDTLVGYLPEHPPLFPKDQLVDGTEKFIVSEIIREKMFHHLSKELPYSVAVIIESFDESNREGQKGTKPRVKIGARIIVERKSQRGIVIGKGGSMIKTIGTEARKELIGLLGCKVHLDLYVSIEKDWTKSPRVLRQLGFE